MAALQPPFTTITAQKKVQAAQDLWNTQDPERVSRGYTSHIGLRLEEPREVHQS